jgi:hypothetical protein
VQWIQVFISRIFWVSYMIFVISNPVLSDWFCRVNPLILSVRFDSFVFSDVWSEFESVCSGLVIASDSASDSDSDSAAMISVVI